MDSHSTADRILLQLKSRGPQTAQAVADAFGISVMGAHKALGVLGCAGLVRHEDVAEGRGRPRRVFALTEAGHRRFPDRHAELNAELIDMIRTSFGEAGLGRLIAEREARQMARYALVGPGDLAGKVAFLAELRAAEGYMARLEQDADGTLLLVEDHCPICAAASACQGFCRSELDIFRALLAPEAEVTREEHLMAGGRRCTYRVRPKSPDSAS
ncbi:MAG: transcriptional regulator [Alphaproteobacteria bacterium]|nr:transcriptional regulator [Alphaproteobacteria bacterium]